MATRHPAQDLLAPLLLPLSRLYGRLLMLRRCAWEAGRRLPFLPSPSFFGDPPLPCVSVGNISWGGTGKTPLVDWLLDWASERGLQVVVLTRGYRAHPPRLPFRAQAASDPREAGDEAVMLARRHPGATIMVDPKRTRAAKQVLRDAAARRKSGLPENLPDLFVLDDGFQHVAMGRHLDLVLLDEEDCCGAASERPANVRARLKSNWNRVIPAGTWREPQEALSRAGAFLVKTTPERWADLAGPLKHLLAPFGRPVFPFALRARGLIRCDQGAFVSLEDSLDEPYLLVSGVGNPAQVEETATAFFGMPPERSFRFGDHHAYTTEDVTELTRPGLPVVCTTKDADKLAGLGLPRLYALDVKPDFFAVPDFFAQPDFFVPSDALDFPTWWQQWWKVHARRVPERAKGGA